MRIVCSSVVLAALVCGSAQAATFTKVMYFPTAAQPADANKTLIAELQDDTKLHPDNACASISECATKYRLEKFAGGRENVPIRSVTVTNQGGRINFETLTLSLDAAPSGAGDLSLTVFDLIASLPTEPDPAKRRKALGKAVFTAPQVALQPAAEEDALRFEGVRAAQTIEYQSLTPIHFTNTPEERAKVSSKITVTDADPVKFKQPYGVYVVATRTEDSVGILHELDVVGIPRSAKVDVKIVGLESFASQPLEAKASVQGLAVPKGRDDAEFYVNIGVDADELADSRKYKLDLRVQEKWRTGQQWVVGPTLDVMVGNKTSKAPNTGSLAIDFQRWFARDLSKFGVHSAAIVYSPVFRTDREFDNRQVGLDVAFEPLFNAFEQQLITRRTREAGRGGPALARKWGWRIRPSVAVEYGRHLASTSPEVDEEAYTRLRGGISMTVERLQWQLSVTAVARYLFEDEVLLQIVNNEPTVLRTTRDQRRHARVELAYNFGVVSLSLTRADGRLPPAFTSVNTTALGVAFKF